MIPKYLYPNLVASIYNLPFSSYLPPAVLLPLFRAWIWHGRVPLLKQLANVFSVFGTVGYFIDTQDLLRYSLSVSLDIFARREKEAGGRCI